MKWERLIEGVWPYAAAAALTAGWYWGLNAPFPTPASPLLGAALTAVAVVVGFLATAKAVMLGVASSPIFVTLKEAGFTGPLFRYLFEAVWLGIAFLVFSVIGFFLDKSSGPLVWWYPPIWIFGGLLVILLYARITRLLFLLLGRA